MRKLLWFTVGLFLALLMAVEVMLGPFQTTSAEEVTPPPQSPTALPTAWPTTQPTTPSGASLHWRRERSFSGACDSLCIEGASQVRYGPCNQGSRLGRLGEQDLRTYLVYVARYTPFEYSGPGDAGSLGDLAVYLSFVGRGSRQPTDGERAEVAGWVANVYDRLVREEQQADLLARARVLLAERLGISPDAIRTLSVQKVTWSDACLEVELEGVYCAQVRTPGYRILLQAAGRQYELRTNMHDLVRQVKGALPTPTQVPPTLEPTAAPTLAPTPTPWATADPPAITEWRGEYYGNSWLIGTPLLVRNDEEVDFDWGYQGPAASLPRDHFSVRFTQRLHLAAGRYLLRAVADDGVRIYVDDQLVIDGWSSGLAKEHLHQMWLEGEHELRVEYFENESRAMVRFVCERSLPPKPKS